MNLAYHATLRATLHQCVAQGDLDPCYMTRLQSDLAGSRSEVINCLVETFMCLQPCSIAGAGSTREVTKTSLNDGTDGILGQNHVVHLVFFLGNPLS